MKILEIDIETAPNVAYVWSLFDQNVPIDRLVAPGYTLCFAARWQGSREIMFHSVWTDGPEAMIAKAWALLNEADMLVHYNGKKFDVPTLNREFVLVGMVPPSNYHEVDLYQVVRRRFRFASNKLDFVAQQLGLGSKVRHKGMQLWREVMGGVEKSQRVMERYNKGDVRLLARLYTKLLPWINNHPNRGLWVDNPSKPVCRNCGGTHLKKNGSEKRFTLSYNRFKCLDCGANLRSRISIKGQRNANIMV
ncbi:MAG: hypothetical protein A3E01_07070 [Gammaproteobacteria bacterium RIFCSPHIGHO2_12_FULL_63_22]|nr:MAG: hypothetical protein A3E01_07070 [Gammaproteobacteria bacterium RIFCSPHIGHO2_12_FULL_63_22]